MRSFRRDSQSIYQDGLHAVTTLRERLLYVAAEQNWGAPELAEAAGRSRVQAYRWTEADSPRRPSDKALRRIADAAGVPFDWLADGAPRVADKQAAYLPSDEEICTLTTWLPSSRQSVEDWPTSVVALPAGLLPDDVNADRLEAVIAPYPTAQSGRKDLILVDTEPDVVDDGAYVCHRDGTLHIDTLTTTGVWMDHYGAPLDAAGQMIGKCVGRFSFHLWMD